MEFQRKKSFQEKIKKSLRRNFSIEIFKIENFFNVNSKKKILPKNFEEKKLLHKDFPKKKYKRNSRKNNLSKKEFQN